MQAILPPLQYAVLTLVSDNALGRDLRQQLKTRFKVSRSLPAFYQLMSRLEESGLVRGRYEQLVIDGQPVKQRWYAITARGRAAVAETLDFHVKATK